MKAIAGLLVLAALFSSSHAGRSGLVSGARSHQLAFSSCDTCLFSFRVLDDVLGDTQIVQDLVAFVQEHVCPAVGGGEKVIRLWGRRGFTAAGVGWCLQCTNLAEGLLPVVVDWIRNPATGQQVCKDTGACPASMAVQVPALEDVKVQDSQCALCELIISEGQQLLNNSQVLDKINTTVQQMCTQLPPDMADVCSTMVNKYEPLITALITKASPEELCSLLGLCSAALQRRLTLAMQSQPRTMQPEVQALLGQSMQRLTSAHTAKGPLGDSCDVCKMAVIEVHSIIVNPQVQDQLTNYTLALCDSMGPSFADTCKLYVQTYAPVVYSILAQYLVPDTICTEIGVCQPPSALMEMLTDLATALLTPLRDALGHHTQATQVVAKHMANAAARNWEQQDAVAAQ